jgi:hypothetical protein
MPHDTSTIIPLILSHPHSCSFTFTLTLAGGAPNGAGSDKLMNTTQAMSNASEETKAQEQQLRMRIHTKNFDIESDRAAIALAEQKVRVRGVASY